MENLTYTLNMTEIKLIRERLGAEPLTSEEMAQFSLGIVVRKLLIPQPLKN